MPVHHQLSLPFVVAPFVREPRPAVSVVHFDSIGFQGSHKLSNNAASMTDPTLPTHTFVSLSLFGDRRRVRRTLAAEVQARPA
jgi:hypothetical protein